MWEPELSFALCSPPHVNEAHVAVAVLLQQQPLQPRVGLSSATSLAALGGLAGATISCLRTGRMGAPAASTVLASRGALSFMASWRRLVLRPGPRSYSQAVPPGQDTAAVPLPRPPRTSQKPSLKLEAPWVLGEHSRPVPLVHSCPCRLTVHAPAEWWRRRVGEQLPPAQI